MMHCCSDGEKYLELPNYNKKGQFLVPKFALELVKEETWTEELRLAA